MTLREEKFTQVATGGVILLFLAGAVFFKVYGLPADPEFRAGVAKAHGAKLGYDVVGAACSNRDSDLDGYVSCTMTYVEHAQGEADHLQHVDLECNAVTCKAALPKLAVPTRR